MAKKLRALVFDVVNDEFKEVTITDTLSDYYEMTNCDCIDMPNRFVGNRLYTIVCDDEGMLKGAYVSAMDCDNNKSPDERAILVGNLIFLRQTYDGDVKSLAGDDVEYIKKHSTVVMDKGHPMTFHHVVDISYYGKEV